MDRGGIVRPINVYNITVNKNALPPQSNMSAKQREEESEKERSQNEGSKSSQLSQEPENQKNPEKSLFRMIIEWLLEQNKDQKSSAQDQQNSQQPQQFGGQSADKGMTDRGLMARVIEYTIPNQPQQQVSVRLLEDLNLKELQSLASTLKQCEQSGMNKNLDFTKMNKQSLQDVIRTSVANIATAAIKELEKQKASQQTERSENTQDVRRSGDTIPPQEKSASKDVTIDQKKEPNILQDVKDTQPLKSERKQQSSSSQEKNTSKDVIEIPKQQSSVSRDGRGVQSSKPAPSNKFDNILSSGGVKTGVLKKITTVNSVGNSSNMPVPSPGHANVVRQSKGKGNGR